MRRNFCGSAESYLRERLGMPVISGNMIASGAERAHQC